jgi:hypothetical protein
VNPEITAEVNLTGWLEELQRDLDAALADMMQVCRASDQKTYKPSQRIGMMDVVMTSPDGYGGTAPERAARACFLTGIGKFVSFLDKLIASQRMKRDGIKITRDLSGDDELKAYLNEYSKEQVNIVAHDQRLTDPKKIDSFPGLPTEVRSNALAYFQLRRALEHHQDLPGEELTVPMLRLVPFVGDTEMKEIPFVVHGGDVVQLRMLTEQRKYPAGVRIVLSPQDAYALHMTMRLVMAPEILRVHLESMKG